MSAGAAEADAGPVAGTPFLLRREAYGSAPDGTPVHRWTFGVRGGVVASVLTYGAILQSCRVPDRDGRAADVVLGLAGVAAYAADEAYLGCVVGRYANRIAGGRFELDGTEYRLPVNDRGNTLHGGPAGFHRRTWAAAETRTADRVGVRLRLLSPDGEMGFPGALRVQVTYAVDRFGTLSVDYEAVADRPTVVNLTQHAYWNLAGGGPVVAHELVVDADAYLPVDARGTPLGPQEPVAGTPFELRGRTLGEAIAARHPQVAAAGGLDHCFVLRDGGLRRAARLVEPASGRAMEVWTTEPGLQVYTANGLGAPFGRHAAVCLETQNFPDAPNRPQYPSAVLRPGHLHRSTTHHRFTHLSHESRAHGGSAAAAPAAPD